MRSRVADHAVETVQNSRPQIAKKSVRVERKARPEKAYPAAAGDLPTGTTEGTIADDRRLVGIRAAASLC
jgi:hypothetical protein